MQIGLDYRLITIQISTTAISDCKFRHLKLVVANIDKSAY